MWTEHMFKITCYNLIVENEKVKSMLITRNPSAIIYEMDAWHTYNQNPKLVRGRFGILSSIAV